MEMPGGHRPLNHRAVGFATPTSYAARAGVLTNHELKLAPDHSVGAGQVLYTYATVIFFKSVSNACECFFYHQQDRMDGRVDHPRLWTGCYVR
jgi:hypothetical protein